MPNSYQLRVVLRDVSPMIWRRLLVRSDTSVAELHAILQAAMDWSDTHLHRFRIHGKAYGIARLGGISFADDPFRVQLCDFQLHRGPARIAAAGLWRLLDLPVRAGPT